MVVYAFNPSTEQTEAGESVNKSNLGCMVHSRPAVVIGRPCRKKEKQKAEIVL